MPKPGGDLEGLRAAVLSERSNVLAELEAMATRHRAEAVRRVFLRWIPGIRGRYLGHVSAIAALEVAIERIEAGRHEGAFVRAMAGRAGG